MGTHDWEVVAKRHHRNWPDKDRSAISLKNKFAKLTQANGQTGDPDCPPETLEVFLINDIIRDKAGLSTTDILVDGGEEDDAAQEPW
jgi:hypothetical protein